MTALLILDVTLIRRDDKITVSIRFRGGRTQTVEVPAPIRECDRLRTDPAVVTLIDELLDAGYTHAATAAVLNERGLKTGAGDPFSAESVNWVRQAAGLKTFDQRIRDKGMLTCTDMAKLLGVSRHSIKRRFDRGELRARRVDGNGRWLYLPLDQQPGEVGEVATITARDAATTMSDSLAGGAV